MFELFNYSLDEIMQPNMLEKGFVPSTGRELRYFTRECNANSEYNKRKALKVDCKSCCEPFCSKGIVKSLSSPHEKENSPTKCSLCEKDFATVTALKKHQQIHAEQKLYICKVCDKQFSSAKCLKQHKHLIEDSPKIYICPICLIYFYRKQHFEAHYSLYSVTSLVCGLCDHNFPTQNILQNHFATHKEIEKFMCNMCKLYFASSRKLKEHEKFHASLSTKRGRSRSGNISNGVNINNVEDSIPEVNCDVCERDKLFFDSADFKSSLGNRPRICRPTGNPFKICDFCDRIRMEKCQLQQSLAANRRDSCPHCDILPEESSLYHHIIRNHFSLKSSFNCTLCRLHVNEDELKENSLIQNNVDTQVTSNELENVKPEPKRKKRASKRKVSLATSKKVYRKRRRGRNRGIKEIDINENIQLSSPPASINDGSDQLVQFSSPSVSITDKNSLTSQFGNPSASKDGNDSPSQFGTPSTSMSSRYYLNSGLLADLTELINRNHPALMINIPPATMMDGNSSTSQFSHQPASMEDGSHFASQFNTPANMEDESHFASQFNTPASMMDGNASTSQFSHQPASMEDGNASTSQFSHQPASMEDGSHFASQFNTPANMMDGNTSTSQFSQSASMMDGNIPPANMKDENDPTFQFSFPDASMKDQSLNFKVHKQNDHDYCKLS